MICSYFKDRDIPVLCGFPAGHGDVNLPLILGAPVTLDVRADGATLTFELDGPTQGVSTEDAAREIQNGLQNL
jgi:muramoyltetrapeptide carboxypeptidase